MAFGRAPSIRQLKALCRKHGITLDPDPKGKGISSYEWMDEILNDPEFQRWRASPVAAKIREREAELIRLDEEERRNNPHLYRRNRQWRHDDPIPVSRNTAAALLATPANSANTPAAPAASSNSAASANAPTNAAATAAAPANAAAPVAPANPLEEDLSGDNAIFFENMTEEDYARILQANADTIHKMSAAGVAGGDFVKKTPHVATTPKLGRNDPCPFDPTRKFKRCCGVNGQLYCKKQAEATASTTAEATKK
jgi:hypothetical protein